MRHVARLHAHGLRAGPVNFHKERGVVKGLLNVDIHCTRNVTEFAREFLPDQIISALVHAGDFHVDGCGSAEIQDLCHDVRWLKEELHSRETLRKSFAQVIDIRPGGFATHFLQLNKNFRIGGPDGAGVAVREVDAAVRHANIVEDRSQLVLRDGFTDDTIYLVGQARGFFDTQPGASAQVKANLSRVHLWKEIAPKNTDEHYREHTESQETSREQLWRMKRHIQRSPVAFAESFKTPLKALLIAAEEAHLFAGVFLSLVFVFRAQEIHGQGRHDRARPHVRS